MCKREHLSLMGNLLLLRFTCVGIDMIPQKSDGAEGFQAKVTHMRLFSAVGFHVTIKTRNSRRGEHAAITAEGSLYFCKEKKIKSLCICRNLP